MQTHKELKSMRHKLSQKGTENVEEALFEKIKMYFPESLDK